jgi:pimeloyl-ACP methyl ester carboxylesterase
MHRPQLLLAALAACVVSPSPADPAAGDDTGMDPDPPVVVDPACMTDGCLQDVREVVTLSRADLAPYLDPRVTIDNGLRVFVVRYATDGRSSTATITIPHDFDAEPADGWPVVVNAHGTVGLDDPCRLSGTVSGTGLAGLFGARGAIGVAPDYPGLGTPGLHDYLSVAEEGASVLDSIRAAHELARDLDVRSRDAAAVVGLSQGGHAVFAAAARHADYAPELDIRAFGVAAPAGAYAEHWRDALQFDGPHLANIALLVWDWTELSGAAQDMWAPGFATNVDTVMRERCMWSPAVTDEPTIPAAVPSVVADVFTPSFTAAWISGEWGEWAYLGQRFAEARVVPFTQTAPIRIWQGSADLTVLPEYTEALVDDLVAGGMQIELVEVPGGTHLDTAFGFLASYERATDDSVAWIHGRLQ